MKRDIFKINVTRNRLLAFTPIILINLTAALAVCLFFPMLRGGGALRNSCTGRVPPDPSLAINIYSYILTTCAAIAFAAVMGIIDMTLFEIRSRYTGSSFKQSLKYSRKLAPLSFALFFLFHVSGIVSPTIIVLETYDFMNNAWCIG